MNATAQTTAVIAKSWLNRYDAGKGTFRTFLRVCLDRFLANDHKLESRQKRCGDVAAENKSKSPAETPPVSSAAERNHRRHSHAQHAEHRGERNRKRVG